MGLWTVPVSSRPLGKEGGHSVGTFDREGQCGPPQVNSTGGLAGAGTGTASLPREGQLREASPREVGRTWQRLDGACYGRWPSHLPAPGSQLRPRPRPPLSAQIWGNEFTFPFPCSRLCSRFSSKGPHVTSRLFLQASCTITSLPRNPQELPRFQSPPSSIPPACLA